MAAQPVLTPVRRPFRAVAESVAPPTVALDEEGWRALEAIVEDALVSRPARVRRQVRLFLRMLDAWCALRHGRGLARLERGRRARWLAGLQRSRLLLVRRGLWGVRTLVFMGYYGEPCVQAALGYGARPGGWAERGRDAGTWPERQGFGAPEQGAPIGGEARSREASGA